MNTNSFQKLIDIENNILGPVFKLLIRRTHSIHFNNKQKKKTSFSASYSVEMLDFLVSILEKCLYHKEILQLINLLKIYQRFFSINSFFLF